MIITFLAMFIAALLFTIYESKNLLTRFIRQEQYPMARIQCLAGLTVTLGVATLVLIAILYMWRRTQHDFLKSSVIE